MAFNKARVQNRKDWLLTHGSKAAAKLAGQEGMGPADDETDAGAVNARDARIPADGGVSFQEFINEELVQFSLVDLHRSIPSVVDGRFTGEICLLLRNCQCIHTSIVHQCLGLKPSQRKVLFSCFKRKLTEEMKVAQLSGYCSEHAGYHHGEMSLHSTIVGMAQVRPAHFLHVDVARLLSVVFCNNGTVGCRTLLVQTICLYSRQWGSSGQGCRVAKTQPVLGSL